MGGDAISGRRVRLALMDERQFEEFAASSVREYARDKVLAGQWAEPSAPRQAAQALASLLPRGLATPDHHLFVAEDAASGATVGTAWLHVDRSVAPPFGYLYDIRVDDAVQGLGYGRALLDAVEGAARQAGCASLRLHVFGHNDRARRLYEGAGYRATNLNMRKDFR